MLETIWSLSRYPYRSLDHGTPDAVYFAQGQRMRSNADFGLLLAKSPSAGCVR